MLKENLPTKRVVIAGCRNYNNYIEAEKYIDICLMNLKEKCNIIIVSGGSTGADALGERYAKEKGFEVERYPADWDTFGVSAGPIRNRQMAEVADYVICFWDGNSRGTKSMIDFAEKYDKPIKVKMI